jgi:hypothetical protein
MQPTTIMKMRGANSGRFCQYDVENVCELKVRLQARHVNRWIRWGLRSLV